LFAGEPIFYPIRLTSSPCCVVLMKLQYHAGDIPVSY